jgi:hypothetical protein
MECSGHRRTGLTRSALRVALSVAAASSLSEYTQILRRVHRQCITTPSAHARHTIDLIREALSDVWVSRNSMTTHFVSSHSGHMCCSSQWVVGSYHSTEISVL